MKIIIRNLEIEISAEELKSLQNQNDRHEKAYKDTEKEIERIEKEVKEENKKTETEKNIKK